MKRFAAKFGAALGFLAGSACLLTLQGCGYHVAGAATHLPPGVRTVAVPQFGTETLQFGNGTVFTQAMMHALNTRTRYRVVPGSDSAQADATLTGTVLSETVAPLTYSAGTGSVNGAGSTVSYLVVMTAKVVLTSADGRVLYRNDRLRFREQYESSQDVNAFVQEDSAAVQRLARDFADTVVSDITSSF